MDDVKKDTYIVDFGDGSYGQIMTVGGNKVMGSVRASNPDVLNPSRYTLDEVVETGLYYLRFVKSD